MTKSKKITLGLILGNFAGIIDLIPMIIQKLTIDACLSAFSMWVIIGFLFSISDLRINGVLKGMLISYLVLIPNIFIIGWHNPLVLIPIAIMTTFLGAAIGFTFSKIIKE